MFLLLQSNYVADSKDALKFFFIYLKCRLEDQAGTLLQSPHQVRTGQYLFTVHKLLYLCKLEISYLNIWTIFYSVFMLEIQKRFHLIHQRSWVSPSGLLRTRAGCFLNRKTSNRSVWTHFVFHCCYLNTQDRTPAKNFPPGWLGSLLFLDRWLRHWLT